MHSMDKNTLLTYFTNLNVVFPKEIYMGTEIWKRKQQDFTCET